MTRQILDEAHIHPAIRQTITDNNAGVRVFRARQALHRQLMQSCGTCAEHGCVECTCKSAGG